MPIIKTVIAFALFTIGFASNALLKPLPVEPQPPATALYGPAGSFIGLQKQIYLWIAPTTTTTLPQPVYKHGDCSWLPKLALQAGWQVDQLKQLRQIALRESGCCPNRAGGDKVDKDCNITGVAEWSHRSDSGLMQINGVHWLPTHAKYDGLICKQMQICTQTPLFDPLTNLKAARLLYEVAGWQPWSICHRDKTCATTNN